MKRIVCEMCGGTDLVKSEGLFVCQSCGCKYTVEEARKMMIEVAGTVEVTGTVKVDNSASVDTYLSMARNAVDAGNNKEAEDYANRVIEIDANNWNAWMLKAKAAGWQSTLQNIRFSESVYAYGQAISCAPEQEKTVILEEAREQVKKLGTALAQLRASRFEKWPDEEEAEGAKKDLSTIFETIIQFNQQLGSSLGMQEMIRPIAEIITSSVSNAWNGLIKPEFEKDNDGHPSDYALTKMLDRAGNCLTIMRTVTNVSDDEDIENIARYDLMIAIHRYCIRAKSYEKKVWTDYKDTLTGREYFTRKQYVVKKSLNDNAIELRNKEIEEWEKEKRSLRLAADEKRKAERASSRTRNEPISDADAFRAKYSKDLSWILHDCFTAAAAVKTDGTVLYSGFFNFGKTKMNLSDWTDIIDLGLSSDHVIGLRADGTVIAQGDHSKASDSPRLENKFKVSAWSGIIAVAAGRHHSLGLREDGTVVASGLNNEGECNVNAWTDIVAITSGGSNTIGLKADGTLVAAGYNSFGSNNIAGWSDVTAIAAGSHHTLGLKRDGTVIATKFVPRADMERITHLGQCDVEDWTDIVAIAAGSLHSVGLRADGTVCAVGNNESGECNVDAWTDIIAIAAGLYTTLGLRSDGRVVVAGDLRKGSREAVAEWRLFDNFAEFEGEIEQRIAGIEASRRAIKEKAEADRKEKVEALNKEKAQLQAELPTIKGLFAGVKKSKIETRIAEIDAELKSLR